MASHLSDALSYLLDAPFARACLMLAKCRHYNGKKRDDEQRVNDGFREHESYIDGHRIPL